MFSCAPFSFVCGQAFTCDALFTVSEAFLCTIPYTLSVAYTLDESFLCEEAFTSDESFVCTEDFLCIQSYDCVYLVPKDWGRYIFAYAIIHGGIKFWAPPSTKHWAGAHVLTITDFEYEVFVEKQAFPLSIIHGGAIAKSDGSHSVKVGSHLLSSISADRTVIVVKDASGQNLIHGGAWLKDGATGGLRIGSHILAISDEVIRNVVVEKSSTGNVIIHAGAWYYVDSVVPIKIGSHILITSEETRSLEVSKSTAPTGLLHTGASYNKTDTVVMYRTVYKDVGLGSGENLAMQNIENNTAYLALYSSGSELSGSGYARASVSFGSIYSTAGEKVDSTSDATFPLATTQWDDIDEVRIFSALTGGTQHIAMTIATFDVPLGYVLQFLSGDVEVEAL